MLTPEQRQELETLGAENVRLKLASYGGHRDGDLPGFLDSGGVRLRRDVEDWLAEQSRLDAAQQARRHRQVIGTAYWTLGVAVVAAIAGIIAAWPVVKEWLK